MAIKIPDGEVDKKFKYVEVVLNRMARRLHKTVAVAMPPTPVTHYAARPDGDNVLFRYFFIVDCVLSKFVLVINEIVEEKSVNVILQLSKDGTVLSKTFTAKSGQNTLDLGNMANIKAGITLKLYLGQPVTINRYWLGFLCDIHPGHYRLVKSAIDALEEAADAVDKEG